MKPSEMLKIRISLILVIIFLVMANPGTWPFF